MGEAKRRAAISIDHKVRLPAAIAGRLLSERDVFLSGLIEGVMAQMPPSCCEAHRVQQFNASVLTTGFMMLAAGLTKHIGPIPEEAMHDALAAIRREALGGGLPMHDRERAH